MRDGTVPDGGRRNGQIVERVLSASPRLEMSSDGAALSKAGVLEARQGKLSHLYLPEHRTFLVRFNSAHYDEAEFVPLLDAMVADARRHEVEKVMVDLRWNRGGSIRNTSRFLSASRI